MNKGGLSGIVISVLLILLVLAAIAIVWFFIRGFIFGSSSQLESGVFTSSFSIIPENTIIGEDEIIVQVKRNPGEGEMAGIYILLENENKDVKKIRRNLTMNELETRNIRISKDEHNLNNIAKISISVILLNKNGQEILSPVKDVLSVRDFNQCNRDCAGKACGNDGCGGICGVCSSGNCDINNICVSTCINDCNTGDKRCLGNNYQDCGNFDSDSCYDWNPSPNSCPHQICKSVSCTGMGECTYMNLPNGVNDPGYCENSNSCDGNGNCISQCTNDPGCTTEGRQCTSATRYQICSNSDPSDSCLESNIVNCLFGYSCQQGDCVAVFPFSGLIANWRLNERDWQGISGEVKDGTDNHIDGTAINGAAITTSCIGNTRCGNFDGVNDYIDFGSNSDLNIGNKYTISSWVKTNNPNKIILQKSNILHQDTQGYMLKISNEGFCEFRTVLNTGFVTLKGTGTVTDNNWHWCVVTLNTIDEQLKIYRDGVLENTVFADGFQTTSLNPFKIGASFTGDYYGGQIDEVGMWNRDLTSQEIISTYNYYTTNQP